MFFKHHACLRNLVSLHSKILRVNITQRVYKCNQKTVLDSFVRSRSKINTEDFAACKVKAVVEDINQNIPLAARTIKMIAHINNQGESGEG